MSFWLRCLICTSYFLPWSNVKSPNPEQRTETLFDIYLSADFHNAFGTGVVEMVGNTVVSIKDYLNLN